MAAYLGGRLVFGSGNTCPQDFLFLTGFFSGEPDSEVGAGVDSKPARTETSGVTSRKDSGLIMSCGLSVDGVVTSVPNSDGYISPGVERRDSVGEFSNLRFGVGVWAAQDSILAATTVGGLGVFCCLLIGCCVVFVECSTKGSDAAGKRMGDDWRCRPRSPILIRQE